MSLFDLSDFERQGNIDNDVRFNSPEEEKELLIPLVSNALRTIQIYTPDLEPIIYNNQEFIDSLLNMARGNRHAKIQVLALDTSTGAHQGHALLRLAHQLTSTIEIRIPTEEYQEENMAFILVDQKAFIYRPDVKSFDGIYSPECKYRAGKLSETFTMVWEHAEQDTEARRLSI